MNAFTVAECRFYTRAPHESGAGFVYEMVDFPAPDRSVFPTSMPPIIGDLVVIPGGTVGRVVDRQWHYPEWGSRDWPVDRPSKDSVILVVIVEPAQGVFANEAPSNEEGEEE